MNAVLKKALLLILAGLTMMASVVVIVLIGVHYPAPAILKDWQLDLALSVILGLLGFVSFIIGLFTLDDYIDIERDPILKSGN